MRESRIPLKLDRLTLSLNVVWAVSVFLWLLRLWAYNPTSLQIWAMTAGAALYILVAVRARRGLRWAQALSLVVAAVMAIRWVPRLGRLLQILWGGGFPAANPAAWFGLTAAVLYAIPATLVTIGIAVSVLPHRTPSDVSPGPEGGDDMMRFRPQSRG
jgi:hypothetical protein